MTVELFLWQITFYRDYPMFLNLWTPVIVGVGNTALQAVANRSHKGTQKQLQFLISLELSLVAKCNTCFIKKVSQLKSDIRSCPLENFSLKQASGLMEGGGGAGPDPPGPTPWTRHCYEDEIFSMLISTRA